MSDLYCSTGQFLKTGRVEDIGVLQTPIYSHVLLRPASTLQNADHSQLSGPEILNGVLINPHKLAENTSSKPDQSSSE